MALGLSAQIEAISFRKSFNNCEGWAYFLSASIVAEKILTWRRKIPFFNDVLFDVFTVLGVYTSSLKMRGKFFVGCFQIFRDDPSLSDHGNKVGVAFPAGNDMEMQMTGNTSPRTFPQIKSYIEAIGLVDLLQNLLAPAGQGHHLSQFRACRVGECSHMPVGNHQQVACRVGESIQNKEGVLLAKKNETLPILIR